MGAHGSRTLPPQHDAVTWGHGWWRGARQVRVVGSVVLGGVTLAWLQQWLVRVLQAQMLLAGCM